MIVTIAMTRSSRPRTWVSHVARVLGPYTLYTAEGRGNEVEKYSENDRLRRALWSPPLTSRPQRRFSNMRALVRLDFLPL